MIRVLPRDARMLFFFHFRLLSFYSDCDAIGLDVFSCGGKKHENGGKKHGKRGWGAEGKGEITKTNITRIHESSGALVPSRAVPAITDSW